MNHTELQIKLIQNVFFTIWLPNQSSQLALNVQDNTIVNRTQQCSLMVVLSVYNFHGWSNIHGVSCIIRDIYKESKPYKIFHQQRQTMKIED